MTELQFISQVKFISKTKPFIFLKPMEEHWKHNELCCKVQLCMCYTVEAEICTNSKHWFLFMHTMFPVDFTNYHVDQQNFKQDLVDWENLSDF